MGAYEEQTVSSGIKFDHKAESTYQNWVKAKGHISNFLSSIPQFFLSIHWSWSYAIQAHSFKSTYLGLLSNSRSMNYDQTLAKRFRDTLVDNLEARNIYWSQVQSALVNNQTLSGGTFYTGKRFLWCLTARLTGDHPSSTKSSTITISQGKSKMTSFMFMALLCGISWRSSYGLQFNSSQGENIIPGKQQQILTG